MSRLTNYATVLVCLISLTLLSAPMLQAAKLPDGFRDIKLGMKKTQVLDVLRKSAEHLSFDDMGEEIAEIIRGDELVRFATYRFDAEGTLVEIDLQMREIIGRDKVIELFANRHGIKLSPTEIAVEADLSVEVKDNTLVIRKKAASKNQAAKGGS